MGALHQTFILDFGNFRCMTIKTPGLSAGYCADKENFLFVSSIFISLDLLVGISKHMVV